MPPDIMLLLLAGTGVLVLGTLFDGSADDAPGTDDGRDAEVTVSGSDPHG